MTIKRVVYFVARSENVPSVLQEVLKRSNVQAVSIFFDLDGTRALDERYVMQISLEKRIDLPKLFKQALDSGVKLYACQMNVMNMCELHCIEGVESAGVVTFLEHAYEADAVFSY